MRLASDRRGRVPFALIGVLLLVSSLAIVTVQFDDARVDRDVRLAGDRAEASAESALRDATRAAGASAAANPVVEPADTPFGAVVAGDRPYRDYLELLVAVRLRERADSLVQRVDDVRASLELPPIDDAASAEAALDRTTVTAAGSGLVNVTVANATVAVRSVDDGAVLDRRDVELSATVPTPALTLHDRTAEFQRLLDAGPRVPGSASRGLTGGLYGLGWARGYGQYAGLPIDDVIANRHVELLTNLALLDAQRVAFGNSDREAETGLAAESIRVAANETVGFGEGGFADAALPEAGETGEGPSLGEVASPPTRTTVVGVNESADRALADVVRRAGDRLDGDPDGLGAVLSDSQRTGSSTSLDRLVRAASSIEAGVATATDPAPRERVSERAPPNRTAWRHEVVGRDRSAVNVSAGGGPVPEVGADWSVAIVETRTVAVEEREAVRYTHEETGAVTLGERVYRREVGVGVALAHRPLGDGVAEVPLAAPAEGLHGRLVDRAESRLLEGSGGVDRLARSVATGGDPDRRVTVGPTDVGADLEATTDAVYADLASLRERLRTVRTETEQAFVATDADPAGELADRLAAERGTYVRVPGTYDDLEHRATVVARSVYVDRTIDHVQARSVTLGSTQDALADAVDDLLAYADAGLADLLGIGLEYARPEPTPIETRDPAPDLSLAVDADPGYLVRDAVNDTAVPAPAAGDGSYYPLATRTRTVGSLPTGELVESVGAVVVDLFGEPERRAPASAAARALQGANRLPPGAVDGALASDRERLQSAVETSLERLVARSEAVVAARTSLDDGGAAAVVEDALARWDGASARVLAFENGSATDAIGAAARDRPAVEALDADRAETVLREELPSVLAEDRTTVPADVVEPVVDRTREVVETAVADATEAGVDRTATAIEERFGDSPIVAARGIPVAPVPGWWIATANVWTVDVRGTYASFRVRARQGGPDGGGHVTYVRDGGPVGVDVTGDGAPERLGHSSRVSFEASTAVLVAVPPGGGGVGNGDQGWEQASDGWTASRDGANGTVGSPGGGSDAEPGSRSRPGRGGEKGTWARSAKRAPMLHEERTEPAAASPEALADEYRAALAAVVEDRGVDAVADATGVDEATLTALAAGEAPEIDLEDAAAIQALATDLDAETVHVEATEHLLLGMSMAVLDVETLAAEYSGERSAKAIQQRLERRAPMTLAEFARLEHFVASRRQ